MSRSSVSLGLLSVWALDDYLEFMIIHKNVSKLLINKIGTLHRDE